MRASAYCTTTCLNGGVWTRSDRGRGGESMHDTHRPGTCKSTLATLQRRLTPQTHPHSGIAPCLILASVNAYNLWNEHWEHWSHMPPLEERVEYPYQNIRTKNFPWGDGDKTIFWNDSVNYHNKDKTT